MSFRNAKIPEKVLLSKYTHDWKQNYFSGDSESNVDFDEINELLKGKPQAEISKYKTGKLGSGQEILENGEFEVRLIGATSSNYGRQATSKPGRVLFMDKYVVPIYSDVLVEAIFKDGVGPNGLLNSKFTFMSNNSVTSLFRVGSTPHEVAKRHMEDLNKPKMKNISFTVGNIYEGPSGKRAMFLGYVNTLRLSPEFITEQNVTTNKTEIKDFLFKTHKPKLSTLWLQLSDRRCDWTNQERLEEQVRNALQSSLTNNWDRDIKLHLTNSHHFIKDTEMHIPNISSKDVIYGTANKYRKNLLSNLKDNLDRRTESLKRNGNYNNYTYGYSYSRYYDVTKNQVINYLSSSSYINMQIYGLPVEINDCFTELKSKILVPLQEDFLRNQTNR